MSQYSYVATSQRSTVVTQALVSHFTSTIDVNLILVKNNYLEIYLYKEEQIILLFSSPFYDRIKNIELFKIDNKKSSSTSTYSSGPLSSSSSSDSAISTSLDHIFMLTERKNYCILCYDITNKNIKTKASGKRINSYLYDVAYL
jgi:hypothetical protein